MSIEGLIGSVILVLVGLVTVSLPFLRRNWAGLSPRERAIQKARDELLTTYERVLATIRDLDEDYQTGKLTDTEYQQERGYWAERGVYLLQQLEPDAASPEPVRASPQETVLDDAIENAIKAYRQAQNV